MDYLPLITWEALWAHEYLSKEIIGQFKRKGTYWNWKAHIPFSLFFFMTWKYFNLAYKNPRHRLSSALKHLEPISISSTKEIVDGYMDYCCPPNTNNALAESLSLSRGIWTFEVFYGKHHLSVHTMSQNVNSKSWLLGVKSRGIIKIKDLKEGWSLLTYWKKQILTSTGYISEPWKSLSCVRLWDPMDYTVHGIYRWTLCSTTKRKNT